MQFILGLISFAATFIMMYLIAKLISEFFTEKPERRRLLIFAFITGTLMQSVWVYAVYFFGGMMSFAPFAYLLITTPNPVFAIVYYFLGTKVLGLPKIRSMKVMSCFYMYYIITRGVYRFVGSIFFVQTEKRYNYLLDAASQIVCILLAITLFFIIRFLIKKHSLKLKIAESAFVNLKKEFVAFLLYVVGAFTIYVSALYLFSEVTIASLFVTIHIIALLLINVLGSYKRSMEDKDEIKDAHISALKDSIDEFKGIRHDFNNILQTYGGYLAVGDLEKLKTYHSSVVQLTQDSFSSMEVSRKVEENPALISLLLSKKEYALKNKVNMNMSLMCNLRDINIDSLDFSRVVACLLDNAIEAAAESAQKNVEFSINNKTPNSKLIIISNSTNNNVDIQTIFHFGVTNKEGHSGIGLSTVYNTLMKYRNCTFHVACFDNVFTAYIEIRDV